MSLLLQPARCVPFSGRSSTLVKFAVVPCRQLESKNRGSLVVVSAEDKKGGNKKMDSQVKRAQLAEEQRMRNKSVKSATNTSIKKVVKLAEQLLKTPPKSESDVKELETLISLAYKRIDTARMKGVYHDNTAARKKARCARYKKTVLLAAGLYTPAADSPDFAKLQAMKNKH